MNVTAVPPEFRRRFAEHNRNAVFVAVAAGVVAAICWILAYALFYWAAVFFSTLLHGEQAPPPPWLLTAFFLGTGVLCILAALDYAFTRFAKLQDQPIIGWHLFRDFALALPKLTFSAFGNLMACRFLSQDDLERAWSLLVRIQKDGKSSPFTLSQVEPDSRRLNVLLTALQLAGFIDLHRGSEEWFYLVRGDQTDLIRKMIRDERDAVSSEEMMP